MKPRKSLWDLALSGLMMALFVCAGLSIWVSSSLDNRFLGDSYRTPDPASGRILPYEVKGHTVYIDATEQHRAAISMLGMIGSFGLIFPIGLAAIIADKWTKRPPCLK